MSNVTCVTLMLFPGLLVTTKNSLLYPSQGHDTAITRYSRHIDMALTLVRAAIYIDLAVQLEVVYDFSGNQ